MCAGTVQQAIARGAVYSRYNGSSRIDRRVKAPLFNPWSFFRPSKEAATLLSVVCER